MPSLENGSRHHGWFLLIENESLDVITGIFYLKMTVVANNDKLVI